MPRGRRTHLDASILEAALIGLQHQRDQINAKMNELKKQLGGGMQQPPFSGDGPAPKKWAMSAAGRRRIAAAQKRRWAEQKKSQAAPERKRTISAAGRRRISAAAKKRWAEFRAKKATAGKG